jgi:hypothetical protein
MVGKRISEGGGIGVRTTTECTVGEVASTLAGILDDLKEDDRRWILIIEIAGVPMRYVQVLVTREGGLWAECVSDEFLGPEEKLSNQQRELLPLLGWQWPSPPAGPNWQFHDELLDTGTAIAGLMLRTLSEVYGYDSNCHIRVILFPVADRIPNVGEE